MENGTIRIIDLLFAIKDDEGTLAVLELNDMGDETLAVFAPEPSELQDTLTEEDGHALGARLENNSSAAILLFENVWATKFADAMRNANGELILNERIPRAVIDELIASGASESAPASAPA